MVTASKAGSPARPGPRRRLQRLYWTLGNLLLFGGLYLLMYVGGVYADIGYHRMAARGDSDIEAPRMVMGDREAPAALAQRVRPSASVPAATAALPEPGPDASLVLAEGVIASAPPSPAEAAHQSTVSRLVLPSIKVDAKVIEVGWDIVEEAGQQMAVWQVAEFAVGQHKGSANPGESGNIVLAGHVGGYGQVFRDLYYVLPGDPVVLYSQGQKYEYVVNERLIVDEEDAPPEQRAANATLISPTSNEVVTMVTCWPSTGPNKFSQRVIIRAIPVGAPEAPRPNNEN